MEHILSPLVKKRVMRNVYGVWLMRVMTPIVFLELPVLAVLAYLAAQYIFVQRVLENLAASASSIGDALHFMSSAFIHTHTQTQLVLMSGLIVGLFMARDIARGVRNVSLFLR
jgi:hypothetical protein